MELTNEKRDTMRGAALLLEEEGWYETANALRAILAEWEEEVRNAKVIRKDWGLD